MIAKLKEENKFLIIAKEEIKKKFNDMQAQIDDLILKNKNLHNSLSMFHIVPAFQIIKMKINLGLNLVYVQYPLLMLTNLLQKRILMLNKRIAFLSQNKTLALGKKFVIQQKKENNNASHSKGKIQRY